MRDKAISRKYGFQKGCVIVQICLFISIAFSGCTSPSKIIHDHPIPATVTISSFQNSVPEGSAAKVLITRDSTKGNQAVRISLDGNATIGNDYLLNAASKIDGASFSVTIPDGQSFVELAVEIIDDVAAEPGESIIITLQNAAGYSIGTDSRVTIQIPPNDFIVTSTSDTGEGSLRQAILNANVLPGPANIGFDSATGPFGTPQTIFLKSPLPEMVGQMTIDGYIKGRLWKASGVTVCGSDRHRVFSVARGATVKISNITVFKGRASYGAGIINDGNLVVSGVTFIENKASEMGGGIMNFNARLVVINSTFTANTAGYAGGGLADYKSRVTLTNCTFAGNTAVRGGGLFNRGTLLLRNTILSGSYGGTDCVAVGTFDPASTNNLISLGEGCGKSMTSTDPKLGSLGYYNGPTKTFPLQAGSPAINLGDNASAVDEHGGPLQWDQRGNGDPRFVAGFTDIGAFENQHYADLMVDTFDDTVLRACTRAGAQDCSLRGAIQLANADSKASVITFDPAIFDVPRTIVLSHPLPELSSNITIDASGRAVVTIISNFKSPIFKSAPGFDIQIKNISLK